MGEPSAVERDDDLVAASTLAHTSLQRLRMFGLATSTSAVLVTIWMTQPAGTDRGAAGLLLLFTIGWVLVMMHPRLNPLWPVVGPFLTVGITAVLVALTGANDSVYRELYVLVLVMAALTQPTRRLLLLVGVVAIGLAAPLVYAPIDDIHLTELVAELIVWTGVVYIVNRQAVALRQRQDRLEAEVERQVRLAAELRRAEQVRGTILRNLTHELRTPLTVLVGSVALLQADETGEARATPEVRQRLLASLARGVTRLEGLVGDVIRIDRYAGRSDPPAVGTGVAERVRAKVGAAELGARRVELDLEPAFAAVDPDGLDRAVEHLLQNVERHTGEEVTVRVCVRSDGDGGVVLSVEDDGLGFAEHEPQELLAPFVQGEEAAGEARPGVGVGLAVVDRFARSYGGEVHLGPGAGGRGARVVVRLPAAPPPGAAATSEAATDDGGVSRT